jgi:uncharacterized protein (TIGR02391 family)
MPEEVLARAILDAMKVRERHPTDGMANRNTLPVELFNHAISTGAVQPHQRALQDQLERSCRRALDYLDRNRLIEPAPGMNGANGYVLLTPEGRALNNPVDFDQLRTRAWLRPEMLHPKLRGKPYKDFQDGHLGSAVFEAFKIVEIETREAAGLADTEIGQNMMLKVYGENGALTDPSESEAMRNALARLAAGALGRFKNPGSHTHRTFDDALEAIEELMLASRLLRFVDQRTQTRP